MANRPIIELRNICKSFGPAQVLSNVDLTLNAGEVVAIIGPSGSGKTTLLRCINGLEMPDTGTVEVSGHVLDDNMSPRARRRAAHALSASAGFVFQGFNLFPHRTALGNVIEGLVVVRRKERAEAVALGLNLLSMLGLRDRADAYPAQLSGGQRQRVAIARALAMEPAVILFDEPTSALDPERVGEVLASIRMLALQQRSIILVTHEMAFARAIADRVVFMDGGRIIEEGNARSLFDAPQSERTRRFLSSYSASQQSPRPLPSM